jgi:hypothetical protein
MDEFGGWLALAGLGAFHGLNPGMGWLFAVALGLQEKSRVAVWRALPPIALGHALSIAAVVAVVLGLRASVPESQLKWVAVVAVGGFAAFRIVRRKHIRWAGMRVGFRDLTLWSFLMASAHGAGLMLAPLLLGENALCGASEDTFPFGGGLAIVAVHTTAHLAIATVLASLFYEVLGLHLLRQVWFNIDRVWIGALLVTAVALAI